MSYLLRSVLAGPRDRVSGLPQYVDVLGQVSVGGNGMWAFRSVSERRKDPSVPTPSWRLRRGFGATEAGCIVVGITLALAHRPGAAADLGTAVIRRRRLDPATDVVVVPELVEACRAARELPMALVVTTGEDCDDVLVELAALGWTVFPAQISRR